MADTIQSEIRRQRLLEFLNAPRPILDKNDYPELRKGGVRFERRLREQDLRRDKEVLKDRPPRSG